MKTYIRNIALVAAITMPITAMAGQQAIDKCIESIEKMKKGNILKLESLGVNGKTIYEFEVADQNGFEWELMCDAATGKVIEIESEVDSPKSKAFSEKAKITEEDALKIALKSYPGKIEEVEYEIEENGEPTFEIDIMGTNGVETKVEVDAITGKIIEVSIEKWEIGAEEDESR